MNKHFFNIKEDEKTATIEIFGEIGESWWNENENTIQKITEKLKAIEAGKAITVKINSLGGDVNHALAIFEALRERDVTVELTGMNASAATVIAMAGKKRRMSRYGLFLIHKCSSLACGNENELEQTLEEQRKVNDRMLDIYADVTGADRQTLEKLMNENEGKGKWIDSREALEYGFITEEIEPAASNTMYNSAAMEKNGMPRLPKGYAKDNDNSALDKIVERITNIIKKNNNMKIAEENKNLAAIATEITEDTVAKFEEAFEAKNTRITELENSITEKDRTIGERDAEIARLNAIVANIPENKTKTNGDDTNDGEENFADWVKKQPYYNEVKQITGK